MPLDREAVRFVADLLQEVKTGMVGRQVQDTFAIRKDDVLLPRLALGSLWRCR
jgi:hypothetical protein